MRKTLLLLLLLLLMSLSGSAGAALIRDPSPLPGRAYNPGLMRVKRDLPRLQRPSSAQCRGELTAARRRLDPIFRSAGRWAGLDWRILAGVSWGETGWGCLRAGPGAPAAGWMAFTDSAWTAYRVDARPDGHASREDAADAVFASARLLRVFVDRRSRGCRGRQRLLVALAAYNAGPAGVRGCDWRNSPAETRRYVPRVTEAMRRLGAQV